MIVIKVAIVLGIEPCGTPAKEGAEGEDLLEGAIHILEVCAHDGIGDCEIDITIAIEIAGSDAHGGAADGGEA